MGANPWEDVFPRIIRQYPPQYFQVPKLGMSERDDFFSFGLHFILGKKLGICRRVNFAKSTPPISKNGRFCEIISLNAQHRLALLFITKSLIVALSTHNRNCAYELYHIW